MPEPHSADNDFVAYFKYKGDLITDGYLDARKASTAFEGIDEAMRYFLTQINPALLEINFEVPVRLREGSWEAVIPGTLNDRLIRAINIRKSRYGGRPDDALPENKLTQNEFSDVKVNDLVKTALNSMIWVLKIARHMGSMNIRKFTNVCFEETAQPAQALIGLENLTGEILYVPQEQLELYRKCPEKLFDKLIKNVESGREFELGLNYSDISNADDTITITVKDRDIYITEEKEEIILFPELKHGDYVVLEGHVSRGNENTNTIGFEYQGHILTCSPTKRTVKDYKVLLFTNCRIKGNIDRSNQYSLGNEKRPHIRFTSLAGLPQPGTQTTLF